MKQQELTESERQLIETMRILAEQDVTFRHLSGVINDRLKICVDRGTKYNGNGTGVMDQIFYAHDQSAFHKMFDPANRLRNICCSAHQMLPDDKLRELPQDVANYADMWSCCRAVRKAGG